MQYEGAHRRINCPHCGQEHELFVKGFTDRKMTTITCGHTGNVNRVRSPQDGCGELIGVKFQLKADVKLYKMTPA